MQLTHEILTIVDKFIQLDHKEIILTEIEPSNSPDCRELYKQFRSLHFALAAHLHFTFGVYSQQASSVAVELLSSVFETQLPQSHKNASNNYSQIW